jgi:hypothetical protein
MSEHQIDDELEDSLRIAELRRELEKAQREYLEAKFTYDVLCERLLSMPDSERVVRQIMEGSTHDHDK